MLCISELFIYPVKSLGGIAVTSAQVTDRGFKHDRRWMLVDEEGNFMTQRGTPEMALFQAEIKEDQLAVYHKKTNAVIHIPFEASEEEMMVNVWSDRCRARLVSKEISEWFSDMLS